MENGYFGESGGGKAGTAEDFLEVPGREKPCSKLNLVRHLGPASGFVDVSDRPVKMVQKSLWTAGERLIGRLINAGSNHKKRTLDLLLTSRTIVAARSATPPDHVSLVDTPSRRAR